MLSSADPRWPRVRTLLTDIVPHNPFYARKYAGSDLTDFFKLPFTTKAELVADQQAYQPYGSVLTYPLERYARLHQTSGTTSGKPLRWLDTPESWEWLLTCWRESFPVMGLNPSDIFFFPFSFGPFLGFWSAFEAASRAGYLCLPGGGLTSTARLRFLMEHRATVVCCTPTYALHLAELAAQEQLDLANSTVRMLIVAGEPGGCIPATRARIEAVWGARVFDHYGMTEVGPVAFEGVNTPRSLFVLESQYVAEIIDPETTLPVPESTLGELVLTNLGRHGSPLLRYRTGDLVRARREAGGLLLLEGGILGRSDEMIHVRGNNLYPSAIEAVVRRFPDVAEFRIVVDRTGPMANIAVEIEPIPDARQTSLTEHVARAIRDELLFRVEVKQVATGSLPRYEMKARRVFIKQG